jgi:hypothetical protein
MGRIEVQGTSHVDPQHVYLGEIARIATNDKDLQQRLERIVIGAAPSPGDRRDVFPQCDPAASAPKRYRSGPSGR